MKTHHNHKMKKDERLMDFRADILVNISSFLEQLETIEKNYIKEDPLLDAFKTPQIYRTNKKPIQTCRSARSLLPSLHDCEASDGGLHNSRSRGRKGHFPVKYRQVKVVKSSSFQYQRSSRSWWGWNCGEIRVSFCQRGGWGNFLIKWLRSEF